MCENSTVFFFSVRTRECTSCGHKLWSPPHVRAGFLAFVIRHYHFEKPLLDMTVRTQSQIFYQVIGLQSFVDVIHHNLILCSITGLLSGLSWMHDH